MIKINPITIGVRKLVASRLSVVVNSYNIEDSTCQLIWCLKSEDGMHVIESDNMQLTDLEFDAYKKGDLSVEDLVMIRFDLSRSSDDPLTEAEELAKKSLFYEKKIASIYTGLMKSSLEYSMDKVGSLSYLNLQQFEYENKYKLSKSIIANPEAEVDAFLKATITKEMESDFSEEYIDNVFTALNITFTGDWFSKMCMLIVIKYESGMVRYNQFNAYAIFFRAKSITLVEQHEWTKLDQGFGRTASLTSVITPEELEAAYESLDSL